MEGVHGEKIRPSSPRQQPSGNPAGLTQGVVGSEAAAVGAAAAVGSGAVAAGSAGSGAAVGSGAGSEAVVAVVRSSSQRCSAGHCSACEGGGERNAYVSLNPGVVQWSDPSTAKSRECGVQTPTHVMLVAVSLALASMAKLALEYWV